MRYIEGKKKNSKATFHEILNPMKRQLNLKEYRSEITGRRNTFIAKWSSIYYKSKMYKPRGVCAERLSKICATVIDI